MYYTPQSKKKKINKIKKFFHNLLKRINIFGHSRLSVMLVPHSEKKIFNFQISNYTIMFTVLLLCLIIVTSVFAIKSQKSTSQKKAVLQYQNTRMSKKISKFIQLTNHLENKQKSLKSLLAKLINTSGSVENNLIKKAFKNNFSDFIKLLHSQNIDVDYIKEIEVLGKIISKIKRVNARLKEIKRHVIGFKNVMKGIPSIWPIYGGSGIFASGFGMRIDPFTRTPSFHSGVDILTMPGHPIRATAGGVVDMAEYHPGNGLFVNIKHRFGYYSTYCHMQRFVVKAGDVVKKGQIIGYVGNTGRSTGYHLHYEVRTGVNQINPAQFLYLDKFFR